MLSIILRLIAVFDKTLLIPIVGIGGAAACFAATYFLKGRRAQKLESLAARLRFGFRREGSSEEKQLMAESSLGIGIYNHVRNVIEPVPADDLNMKVFDYSYSFKNGRNLDTATQTVVHLRSPLLRLPSFLLRPRSRLAKLGQLLGVASEINLANAPVFNRMFLLRGESETAIRQLFTPAVIQHFEQLTGVSVGGGGNALIVYRDRQRARPKEVLQRLAEARAIALALSAASPEREVTVATFNARDVFPA
jgi:hypothetical protein